MGRGVGGRVINRWDSDFGLNRKVVSGAYGARRRINDRHTIEAGGFRINQGPTNVEIWIVGE